MVRDKIPCGFESCNVVGSNKVSVISRLHGQRRVVPQVPPPCKHDREEVCCFMMLIRDSASELCRWQHRPHRISKPTEYMRESKNRQTNMSGSGQSPAAIDATRQRSASLQLGGVKGVMQGRDSKELPSLPATDNGGSQRPPSDYGRPRSSREAQILQIVDPQYPYPVDRAYQEFLKTPDEHGIARFDRFDIPELTGYFQTDTPEPLRPIEDQAFFDEMQECYADMIAIEKAVERTAERARKFGNDMFRKEYADRLATSAVAAVCIKDDLEDHRLAEKYRVEGVDIRSSKSEPKDADPM